MSRSAKLWHGILLGSVFGLFAGGSALADEMPAKADAQAQTTSAASTTTTDNDWHVDTNFYLWFAGMHGTVGADGFDASVHASAADVLSKFNIGFMDATEFRKKRFVIPIDFMWVKLSDDTALIRLPDYSVKAAVKEGFFTPKATYLIVDSEKVQIRATAGVRAWHLGENLKLSPPNTPSFNVGTSQNWADVVGGANFVVPLSPKIFVMVGGDAGGGGADVDYQVSGLVNYQIKPKWGIGVGYRYLDVNYRNSDKVIFDTASSGIALTLLYKFGKQLGQ